MGNEKLKKLLEIKSFLVTESAEHVTLSMPQENFI